MAASTIIINLAYVALMSATLTRTIVPLRLILIASSVGFVTFGVIVGNWTMIGWNILTAGLHLGQLFQHIRSRRRVALAPGERDLRGHLFPELSDFDFSSLWSMGETVEHTDAVLMRRDEAHGRVALILDGVVEVDRGPEPTVRLDPGALIGEMSFVAGGAASAATRAVGRVRLREWQHERLETLEVLNPTASKALHRFIQRDLLAKMT